MNGKQAKKLRKAALVVGTEKEYDDVGYKQVNQMMKKWRSPFPDENGEYEEKTFFTYTLQMVPSVRKLYKGLKKRFKEDKINTLNAVS